MKYYYLDQDGGVVGPIEGEFVQGLIDGGKLPEETRVAAEGTEVWLRATEAFGLASRHRQSRRRAGDRNDSTLVKLAAVVIGGCLLSGGLVYFIIGNSMVAVGTTYHENPTGAEVVLPTPSSAAGEVEAPAEVIEPQRVRGDASPVAPQVAGNLATRTSDLTANAALKAEANVIVKDATSRDVSTDSQGAPHELAEWYDFGFRQGEEMRKASAMVNARISPEREQVVNLIKNLDVDVTVLSREGFELVFEGYQDGFNKAERRFVIAQEQDHSLLPQRMRGYHRFSSVGGASLLTSGANSPEVIYETVLPAFVTVSVDTGLGSGHGSGFFITPSGHILTNHHVVKNAVSIEVTTSDDKRHRAQVIESTRIPDIALLKIESNGNPFLALKRSETVKTGSFVCVIGKPIMEEGAPTINTGIVSNASRDIGQVSYFQLDATLNPGNSGGPLLDDRGRVIGINTLGFDRAFDTDRFNFAIKIDHAFKMLDRSVANQYRVE